MNPGTLHRRPTATFGPWLATAGYQLAPLAAGLFAVYGALHLGDTVAQGHPLLDKLTLPLLFGPLCALALVAHAAAKRRGYLTLPLALTVFVPYAALVGYGLDQAVTAYGPGLAHTAARLL